MRITFWKAVAVLAAGACAAPLLWHGGRWLLLALRAGIAPLAAAAPTGSLLAVHALCGLMLGYACIGVFGMRELPRMSRKALALVLTLPLCGQLVAPDLTRLGAFLGCVVPGMLLGALMGARQAGKCAQRAQERADAARTY